MTNFETFSTDAAFEDFTANKYTLVNVASMRARQINDGVEVYIKSRSKHPLQVALEEIAAGYVGYSSGAEQLPEDHTAEEAIAFDEMINLDTDFDFDDEEATDIEPMEFEEEFMSFDEHTGAYEVEE